MNVCAFLTFTVDIIYDLDLMQCYKDPLEVIANADPVGNCHVCGIKFNDKRRQVNDGVKLGKGKGFIERSWHA